MFKTRARQRLGTGTVVATSLSVQRPRHHTTQQTTFQTSHGQLLDLTTAPIGSVDLSKYTEVGCSDRGAGSMKGRRGWRIAAGSKACSCD